MYYNTYLCYLFLVSANYESDSSIQSLSFKLFPSFCFALPFYILGFLGYSFHFCTKFAKILNFCNFFSKFWIFLTFTFLNRIALFFRANRGFWGCPFHFCIKICKNFKILQNFIKILDFSNFHISQPIWFVFSGNLGFLGMPFSLLH